MRSIRKALLALCGLGLLSQAVAAETGADQAAYAVGHALIDVGGGRRLNVYCSGSGAPSVVFDAGSGLAGWDWFAVHSAVTARTRACIYDRAGFGFSDAADRPGTSANAVDDLHRLLREAGIAPPYVLVGHSYGGANVQLYAYTHPQEVAGLVLVDASHEDENDRLDQITRGKFSKLLAEEAAMGAECVEQLRRGLLPGSPAFEQCVGRPPAAFRTALTAAWLSQQLSPGFWAASESENRNQSIGDAQLRQARTSFGDIPLVYLTHGISPFLVPGRPPSEMNKAAERELVRLHQDVARLSSRGQQRVVAGAAHSIHIDRPQAVVDAIFDVLDQATKQRKDDGAN